MRIKALLAIILIMFLVACGGEADSTEGEGEVKEEKVYVVFRHLDLQTEDTTFLLTGEVQALENEFYYVVDQGQETVIDEQVVELSGDSDWETFEITDELPKEVFEKENPPIIKMYAKTSDDEQVNPNFIPIDIGIK